MLSAHHYDAKLKHLTSIPEELGKAQAQWGRFDRNFAWLKAHA
jgi:hypothetical protein